MKLLYLHGLDGELSPEKNDILAGFGEVISPDLPYRENASIINTLVKQYQKENINVVIGSSMGGFAGYYLSALLQVPALLFNPALPYRSVQQAIPGKLPAPQPYLQVVLGSQDDIIKAPDNLLFLQANINPAAKAAIHIINQLGHRIPASIFQAETTHFFNTYLSY